MPTMLKLARSLTALALFGLAIGCGDDASSTTDAGSASDAARTDAARSGCGDGVVSAREECDDGNEEAGDGCNAGCDVESGWDCDAEEPTTCAAICGDGTVVGPEADTNGCDDGDTMDRDGCDSDCRAEAGWACSGQPSRCAATCGDGVIVAGIEACDDGDMADGDGCSRSCDREAGFTCTGVPSSCSTTCGDGVTAGTELCDDGNTTTETECPIGMATCTACDATCSEPLSLTGGECGDGDLGGIEVCDDGNTTTETECPYGMASCTRCNADCTMTLALAGSYCGDGTQNGTEVCDDGNTTTETTCTYGSATCTRCNATCTATLALTGTYCGDGTQNGTEVCDDGNTATETACTYGVRSCSGCRADCGAALALVGPFCGDGSVSDGEGCDDGNDTSNDGCIATCVSECVATGLSLVTPFSSGGRCYARVATEATWASARLMCQNLLIGGDLAAPATNAERTALLPATTGWPTSPNGWMGATDATTESTWLWSNGETWSYGTPVAGVSPWGGVEPNGGTNENCLEWGASNASFNDLACSATRIFFCEAAAVRAQRCGDGFNTRHFGGAEQCDDGNTSSGDGCDASCAYESRAETEPNDDGATSTGGSGVTGNDFDAAAIVNAEARGIYTSDVLVSASLAVAGDEDVFAIRNTGGTARYVRIETFVGGLGTCTAGNDTGLRVMSSASTEIVRDNDDGPNACSMVDFAELQIPANTTYYVQVTENGDNAAIASYLLAIDFL